MLLILGSHKIKFLDVTEKYLRDSCTESMARNGSVHTDCSKISSVNPENVTYLQAITVCIIG
jgi:hypothetical protein